MDKKSTVFNQFIHKIVNPNTNYSTNPYIFQDYNRTTNLTHSESSESVCNDKYNIESFLPSDIDDEIKLMNINLINKIINIYNDDIHPTINQYLDSSEKAKLENINILGIINIIGKFQKITTTLCPVDKGLFAQTFSNILKQIIACINNNDRKEIVKNLILNKARQYYMKTCNL